MKIWGISKLVLNRSKNVPGLNIPVSVGSLSNLFLLSMFQKSLLFLHWYQSWAHQTNLPLLWSLERFLVVQSPPLPPRPSASARQYSVPNQTSASPRPSSVTAGKTVRMDRMREAV